MSKQDKLTFTYLLYVECLEHKLGKYMLPTQYKKAYLTNNQYVSYAFCHERAACTYRVCAPRVDV